MASRNLERARTALAQGRWGAAYALFAAAGAETELPVQDQERLGLAAFLTGHDEESTGAWSSAHQARRRAEEPEQAAHDAFLIGTSLMFRGELAPAQGWLARGGRLLEGRPETAEHGWLSTLNALMRMFLGDPAGAIPHLAASVAIARRHGDADLLATAQVGEGWSRLLVGDLEAGRRLLDESMVGVVLGEVSVMYAGIAYCSMVAACAGVFDVRRAREWTAALTRFVDGQPGLVPFRGNCLVHRCEMQRLAGAWGEALRTAQEACDLLSGPISWDSLGSAYYQLGEVQRLRGELEAAEQSYLRANEAGHRPEPGLALLRLAQGRVDAAAAMSGRALGESGSPAARAALLPAQVEVLLQTGEVEAATRAADELRAIAVLLGGPYLNAVAAAAEGAVALASGAARSALPLLRAASDQWRDLDCPYELARTRLLLGLACRDLGDDETAGVELDGARATFERLGATPDLGRLEALRAPGRAAVTTGGPAPTVRELEVLRLVATGLTNRAIARRLGLSEKTVARHVHNLLTRLGVPSRAAATAYAYEHGLI